MKEAISGPNCTDPEICHGDCCSIKIDVPKLLAKEYIKRGYATENDFIRTNIFSFHLRLTEENSKCFLYDKEINGCAVHTSGIKPPQCWIYPTMFFRANNESVSCKRASGWKILNSKKTLKAEKLLQQYIFLCQLEARKELKKLKERLGLARNEDSRSYRIELKKEIKETPPSKFGGLKDGWHRFSVLSAQGLTLTLKKLCRTHKKECPQLKENFMECPEICEEIAQEIIKIYGEYLELYVKKQGVHVEGEYPLFKLLNFQDKFHSKIKTK